MDAFLNELVTYLPITLFWVLRSFAIFVMALGIVYMVGRMLELVNSNRGRNLVAVIVIIGLSILSVFLFDGGLVVLAPL